MSCHPWVVAKFGGTSVSSVSSINNLAEIVKGYRKDKRGVLLVVSAVSGVSNCLEELAEHSESVDIKETLAFLDQKHTSLAKELGILNNEIRAFIDNVLQEANDLYERLLDEQLSNFYATQAKIMSLGEMMSSHLLHVYLEKRLNTAVVCTDAREWLLADDASHRSIADRFLNAECDVCSSEDKRSSMSQLGSVVITQGFIACNKFGETVVLGRGGSDTSAAYFAKLIGAERLDIWTDVPGMFSANPRQLPEARQLLQLDYKEAQEIASTGAKVLHPRCLRPAREGNFPVFVGSTFAPEKGGTLIGHFHQVEPQVKAISLRMGVTIIAMETASMWQQPGFLAEAFALFFKHGLSIDQVSTSETNVTVTLDNLTQGISRNRLAALSDDLNQICRVKVIERCAALSIVGRSIRMLIAQLSRSFGVFQNRSVHMLTQAANDLNFTFVVDEDEAEQLVQRLHDSLLSENANSEQIGSTWHELFSEGSSDNERASPSYWWQKCSRELHEIVETHGSAYVYNLKKVEEQVTTLNTMKNIDRVFYAIKANAHPDVLKIVEKNGLGFECVSINEVRFILKLFPNIDRKRVLFTPNFAPRTEYEEAIKLDIWLTLDNLFPMIHWGDLFEGQELFLRIDTGTGKGHHQHVKTAGSEAKFGIPIDDAMNNVALFKDKNVSIIGLHCHVGSGILTSDNWLENGKQLAALVEQYKDVKYLDLGGGLGIVEKPQQQPLDVNSVDQSLVGLKEMLGNIELWLEPGRYIVAESGVLLSRVTQLKGKKGAGYIGIETGMNSLIRPALYGAYHPIVNLSRLDEPARQQFSIVGPICETGDKLGVERLLPETFEGDVILIANTGAYGRVMSSQYNMRTPAVEVTASF